MRIMQTISKHKPQLTKLVTDGSGESTIKELFEETLLAESFHKKEICCRGHWAIGRHYAW